MKTSEVFAAMRADLIENGWIQDTLFESVYDENIGYAETGKRCLDGALIACTMKNPERSQFPAKRFQAMDVMGEVLHHRSNYFMDFVSFNDDQNTTFLDIMEFLDECELKAKESEA